MGQYYEVVCHDCKTTWLPSSRKLEEIQANVRALAEIGAFLVHHRHHRVDVLGDAGDDGGCEIDVNGYREMLPMEIDFS